MFKNDYVYNCHYSEVKMDVKNQFIKKANMHFL